MKRKNCSIIFAGVLIILAMSACGGQSVKSDVASGVTDPEAATVGEMQTAIPRLMDHAMIPGLSIAVIRDGEIFWHQAFGVKSLDTGEAMTDDTVFEAASLSKPMFSYALMKLVESGKLELDRPLLDYVDDAYIEKSFWGRKIDDERLRKITARLVMSHQAGFPNWRSRGGDLTIDFEPGEKFSYSGEGFGLLQRVVEKITGESLNDFMEGTVFEPLGMTHSGYVWQPEFDALTAVPHSPMMKAGKKRKPKRGHAAATLHTTATDYATFLCAILNHTGLSAETARKMLTPQVVAEPERTDMVQWGLGVGLELGHDEPFIWHWGDNGDFKAFFMADPKTKNGVVYFTNSSYGLAVRDQIINMTLPGDHALIDSGTLERYGDVNSKQMALTRVLVKEGVDGALARLENMRKTTPASEIVPEEAVNNLGYYFMMREGDMDTAIKLFKLNVDVFPDSWNAYDSLGEAYMKAGSTALAIENYEKSLELNPENENGRKMLTELKGR